MISVIEVQIIIIRAFNNCFRILIPLLHVIFGVKLTKMAFISRAIFLSSQKRKRLYKQQQTFINHSL